LRALKPAVVSAAVLVLLAGCGQSADPVGGGTPAAAATTTAPADPVQRLKDSTKEIGALNYRFTFKGDKLIGKGYVHNPSHGVGRGHAWWRRPGVLVVQTPRSRLRRGGSSPVRQPCSCGDLV